MREMRQGKCTKCKVRFVWPAKELRLRDAYCVWCGKKLQATTHLSLLQTKKIGRPCVVGEFKPDIVFGGREKNRS